LKGMIEKIPPHLPKYKREVKKVLRYGETLLFWRTGLLKKYYIISTFRRFMPSLYR
jgi:hypothetical protein